jgi:starch synthase
MPENLSIVMLASEAVPFAKTGGLADVMGALPGALAELGLRVMVILPRYRGVPAAEVAAEFQVPLGASSLTARFHVHEIAQRLTAVLVECGPLYERDGIYGIGNQDYPDNALRFAFLSRAGLEFAGRTLEHVDVVHIHDWQTGLAPVYLATLYKEHPVLGRARSVMTIHNLAYQGLFSPDLMPSLSLPWELFGVDGLEYWGKISYLKAGINFSTLVTTVSPTYAKEIQTPEHGFGFDGILRRRSADLTGILNGIDATQWNPMTDPFLPEPYGPDNLSAKRASKCAVLEALEMRADQAMLDRPMVGMVSRMIDQKGFDLLSRVVQRLLRLDATFVMLGTGDTRYEAEWTGLAASHPDQVAARIGFDERLAHLIQAGADIFLMPSRFEPCGLSQMYSLRYGTVPVVHATGGLEDTVENDNPKTGGGTGFKFKAYTEQAFLRALEASFNAFSDRKRWLRIQQAGMKLDFSWQASARKYVRVYERALGLVAPKSGARVRR